MRQTRRATADPATVQATALGTTASATVTAVASPGTAAVAGLAHTPTDRIDGADGRTT